MDLEKIKALLEQATNSTVSESTRKRAVRRLNEVKAENQQNFFSIATDGNVEYPTRIAAVRRLDELVSQLSVSQLLELLRRSPECRGVRFYARQFVAVNALYNDAAKWGELTPEEIERLYFSVVEILTNLPDNNDPSLAVPGQEFHQKMLKDARYTDIRLKYARAVMDRVLEMEQRDSEKAMKELLQEEEKGEKIKKQKQQPKTSTKKDKKKKKDMNSAANGSLQHRPNGTNEPSVEVHEGDKDTRSQSSVEEETTTHSDSDNTLPDKVDKNAHQQVTTTSGAGDIGSTQDNQNGSSSSEAAACSGCKDLRKIVDDLSKRLEKLETESKLQAKAIEELQTESKLQAKAIEELQTESKLQAKRNEKLEKAHVVLRGKIDDLQKSDKEIRYEIEQNRRRIDEMERPFSACALRNRMELIEEREKEKIPEGSSRLSDDPDWASLHTDLTNIVHNSFDFGLGDAEQELIMKIMTSSSRFKN